MTARSIAHAKQIKPAGATAKLAQNSALSARREKGICILCCNSGSRPCELGAKQTIFQDEPGGRLQSRLRGSLKARQASTAEIGANAHDWGAVKIGKKCNLIFFIGCENQWVYQE